MDKEITIINLYGLLWTGSMILLNEGLANPYACGTVGVLSGIIFLAKIRKNIEKR